MQNQSDSLKVKAAAIPLIVVRKIWKSPKNIYMLMKKKAVAKIEAIHRTPTNKMLHKFMHGLNLSGLMEISKAKQIIIIHYSI